MDEYISKEEALNEIRRKCICGNLPFRSNTPEGMMALKVIRTVSSVTATDVRPVVRGEWEPVRESEITGFNTEFAGCDPIGGYVCSKCKEKAVLDCNDQFVLSNFCPNCGADMRGE